MLLLPKLRTRPVVQYVTICEFNTVALVFIQPAIRNKFVKNVQL